MLVAAAAAAGGARRYGSGGGMFGLDQAKGGSPWGAGTLAGPDGSRQPSEVELEQAVYLVGVTVTVQVSLLLFRCFLGDWLS